jgi:hypothetical protein
MDEGDVPGIYVCLGEAVEVRQGRAVEADAAAGGQGQETVSQLGGYGVRVGGGELGVVEGDGLPFEQRAALLPPVLGTSLTGAGGGTGLPSTPVLCTLMLKVLTARASVPGT